MRTEVVDIICFTIVSQTRDANYSGRRELAEKNSKTARTLNHVAVALGLIIIVVYIIYYFVLFNNMNQHP